MSNPSYRAEHYRDMADECRQLATFSVSSKLKSRFLQMADQYGTLAEAEEQSIPYHDRHLARAAHHDGRRADGLIRPIC
jgi:hypothetical protein